MKLIEQELGLQIKRREIQQAFYRNSVNRLTTLVTQIKPYIAKAKKHGLTNLTVIVDGYSVHIHIEPLHINNIELAHIPFGNGSAYTTNSTAQNNDVSDLLELVLQESTADAADDMDE